MPSSLPIPIARTLSLTLALGVLAAWAPARADDFTFRRIAVAPQDGSPRITVQIDPEEQARRLAPPDASQPMPTGTDGAERAETAEAAATPAGAQFGWFWDRVPAGIGQGQGRFLAAIAALDHAPSGAEVPQPSVQSLQDIAAAQGPGILAATVGTRVSPALVLAVIAAESSGRARVVSHAGAQGLMQLIPATAERFGVTDPFEPGQNIRGGTAYLDWLMGQFDNDVVLALAGYNAGEGAVRSAGGVPAFAETRDYVPRVLAAWRVARGLCLTPPQLPSDGCVFAVGALRPAQSSG